MGMYENILSDLHDDDFIKAIEEVIKNTTDIFPGTNLIGMIRKQALENEKYRIEKRKKIEDRRCDPPGPEWKQLKKKLGIK